MFFSFFLSSIALTRLPIKETRSIGKGEDFEVARLLRRGIGGS
jgi:hypothetical protein